jgi:hypothetical protein
MVNFALQYDKRVVEEFAAQVAAAPTTMNIYSTTVIRKEIENYVVRNLVTVPISRPRYPLVWRSPKQRRYVMAKLREEGNLPYQRSGDLQRRWKVIAIRNRTDSLIAVSNNSEILEYVMGSSSLRQPMFPQWPHYEDVLLKAEVLATDLAVNAWFDIVEFGEVQSGSLRLSGRA